MKLSAIHDSFPPCSAAALKELESKIGAELPSEYKQFLMTKNGGFIHHPYEDPECGGSFQTLYALQTGFSPVDLNWNFDNRDQDLPPHLLPIGSDDFGNELCISLSGQDRGSLYFFDHEESGQSFTVESRLSTSFNSFLDRLQLEDEEPDVDLENAPADVVDAFRAIHDDNALLLAQPLTSGLSPNAKDQDDYSLLQYAAFGCRLECIEVLLEYGADINGADAKGTTPLFMAIYAHCRQCVQLLVDNGASIDQPLINGVRPLQEAIEGQSALVAGKLIDLGANIRAPIADGRTIEQLVKDVYSESGYKDDGQRLLEKLRGIK